MKHELLMTITHSKFEMLIQLYSFNRLNQNIDNDDIAQILKYM